MQPTIPIAGKIYWVRGNDRVLYKRMRAQRGANVSSVKPDSGRHPQ
jgi:hypothetical protein